MVALTLCSTFRALEAVVRTVLRAKHVEDHGVSLTKMILVR